MLDQLVLVLLDKETLDKQQIAEVFVPLRRRSVRPAWTGSPDRQPSHIPAVEIPRGDPRARPRQRAAETQRNDRGPGAARRTGRTGRARSSRPPGADGDVHGGTPGAGGAPGGPATPPGPPDDSWRP